MNKLKKFINKAKYFSLFAAVVVNVHAYSNSGVQGVDDTLGLGSKIAMAILALVGTVTIISGVIKLGGEEKNGKQVGGKLIGVGVLAFGILAYWVSKTSGFMLDI